MINLFFQASLINVEVIGNFFYKEAIDFKKRMILILKKKVFEHFEV